MRVISFLFNLMLVHYSFARFINGSIPKFATWYPDKSEEKYRISNILSNIQISINNTKYSLEEVINKTVFYLHTEKNRDKPQKLRINNTDSIINSNWDPSKFTRIIIHGWNASSKEHYIPQMKNVLLDTNSDNVVLFDWSEIAADPTYFRSASSTEKVGKVCGIFIDKLCKLKNGETSKFHLIGHSLGAHVAGSAGKHVTTGKIARISGLDPALPGFIKEGKDGRLDASDAVFVDCIHTCVGILGFDIPLCHADYYPNRGSHPQPGCNSDFSAVSCSHSRAHQFFIESIMNGHEFPAYTCPNKPKSDPVQCKFGGAYMGFPAKSINQGIFYAVTKGEYPYAPVVKDKTQDAVKWPSKLSEESGSFSF